MTTHDDAQRLQSLLQIAKVVGAAGRYDDLIELTAEEARRALDAASVSIARWEGDRGVLRVVVNVGLLGPAEVRFPADETYNAGSSPLVDTLVDQRRGYVSTVDDADEEAVRLRELTKDSSIGVPIVVDARVWGALFATRVAGQARFTDADLDFATAVATHVATGVVQADHVARIERLAFEDPLTGLANRRAVDDRLEAALDPHTQATHPVSVVLADINRLKAINDSFGHEAGDRLIIAVAQAVSRASGQVPGSLAARIGGDEFCIVVTGAGAAAAEGIAEELCRLVDRQPMSTGVSCGVASTDASGGLVDTPVRLLRLADAAQYRAKRGGLRRPVVAGQAVAAASEAVSDDNSTRRRRRGRSPALVPDTLESGLAVLDRLGRRSAEERLQAVAEHVSERVDAAAWWLSVGTPGGAGVFSLRTSIHRLADMAVDHWDETGGALGAVFGLADYPETLRAMRESSSYSVERDAPGNDPAEEALLIQAGYRAVIGAGSTADGCGWLVEIYSDRLSLPLLDLETVLRALVAVAVAGAPVPRLSAVPDQGRQTRS